VGIFDDIRKSMSRPEGEQLRSAMEQTPGEKELAAYVKKKIEDVRIAGNRIAHEGTWMTNIAYLLGFDSVYYNTQQRQFQPLDGNSRVGLSRNRVYENLILPAVQNRQARLCKSPPKWEVLPEDNTNESKEETRLAKKVLLQMWDETQLNLKRLTLTQWLQECGHGYLKVSFDDQLGPALTDPLTGEQMGYEGRVVVEPVSAFEVFPDPLAQNLDDAQWVVQARVRKLDYFRTHYPERGMLVKEEGAWLLSIQYEQRIQSLNNVGQSSVNTAQQMENAAIELSYYEKRSRKHPNGRHVIVANGVILKDDELPVGELPFAKFDDVMVAGKYYSEATITHARPLQDQYNRVLTRRSQWVRRLLAGKYIAARGHGLMQEAINDASGEVVEYDPVPNANEPHAMQIPQMPQYAYLETNDLKKSVNQIFGLSEVARGELPSSSIPAIGMQLLIEQDETRIGVEIEQHEHAYSQIGELMLKYQARFATSPRKLVEHGINNEVTIREYTGKDLPKNPQVKVVRGSTIPTSTAMKRQEVINAYQMGLLGAPQDPLTQERVLGMLEFGQSEGIWEDTALDTNQSQREIKKIEKGEMPDIYKFDNHAFLIRKLNNYRKSDKFLALDEQKQQLLCAVIDKRGEMMLRLQNPQVNQMEENVKDGLTVEGDPLLSNLQPEGEEPGIAPSPEMPQNSNIHPQGA